MEESNSEQQPDFLQEVYELNEGRDLFKALELSFKAIDDLDIEQLKRIGLKTYKEGKWSVHKILQHLIDWERSDNNFGSEGVFGHGLHVPECRTRGLR